MNGVEHNPTTPPAHSACDELRELLPAYAVGALDDAEIARVRELLVECPEAAAELADYAALSTGFLDRIEPVAPPPALQDRLMAQIRAQNAAAVEPPRALPSRRANTRWLAWGAAAAALVLLFGTNVYWVARLNDVSLEIARLRAQQEEFTTVLAAAELARIPLTRPEGDTAPVAVVLWDEASGSAVLSASRLPALPADQTYQLWLIGEGQPVSAGVFDIDAAGGGTLSIASDTPLESLQALAISVEPAGGSPQPTTTPIALGAVA